jgi:hypothetical protein
VSTHGAYLIAGRCESKPRALLKIAIGQFRYQAGVFQFEKATQKIETDATSHPNPGKTEFGMRISPN